MIKQYSSGLKTSICSVWSFGGSSHSIDHRSDKRMIHLNSHHSKPISICIVGFLNQIHLV